MKAKIDPRRSRRTLRRGIVVVLAGIACFAVLLTPAATAKAGRAARPLYWGATIGPQLDGAAPPWNMGAVSKFESLVGKGLSVLAFSSPFADCSNAPCSYFPFPRLAMEELRQRGTIPMLTWASQSVPSSLEEPQFQLANIARGDFDPYIREFAQQAAEWRRPFFLRLNPEMNGFWFPWSEGVNGNGPGQFVAAWRHIYEIFRSAGATNATFVWCPNVDFERRLTPLARLYPGDAYVNWTCLDGFNWGATANSSGWMTFNHIYRSTYKRVARIAPHKPMLIGEVASDNRGGSKSNWITNMLRIIPARYPKVRGVLWYDELDQGMHWPLEKSPSATRAFARGISRKIYRPNVFSELPPGPVRPPGPGLASASAQPQG
jgi:glycosyl hydrolase family 26